MLGRERGDALSRVEPEAQQAPQEPAPKPSRTGPRRLLAVAVSAALLGAGIALAVVFLLNPPASTPTATRDATDAAAAAGDDAGGEAGPVALVGRVAVPAGVDPRTVRVRAFDAEGRELATVVPDAEGRFRLETAGSPAGVIASVAGLPSAVARLPEASAPVEVRLEPGSRLALRVHDDLGAPVAGALAAADPVEPGWTDAERRAVARADAVHTGTDGTATLLVRATGTVEVVVEAEGHVTARPDPLALPMPDPLDVELPRGGRLTGTVVDGLGAPRTGARVRVVGSGLWPARELEADPTGRFDAGLLPPGFYEAEAFDAAQASPLLRGIEIRPGEANDVRLALAPGGFVAGRVTAETTGEHRPGEWLVTLHGFQARLVPLRVRPGDDGSFRVGPLAPGRYLVRSTGSPFLPAEAWTEVAAGATAQVDLSLRLGRTLQGRVVGPDGAAVEGARLSLSGRAEDGGFVFRSPTTEALARIDRRGLAPVGRLLPIGELGVLEGPLPPIPPRPFAWLEGYQADGDEQDLEAPAGGRATQRPAGATPPAVDREAGGMASEASGAFRIDGLPPGKYAVSVNHRDFAPLSQDVVVPDGQPATTVVLQLAEGCTLAGLVRDDEGNPVAGAAVRVSAGLMDPLVWQADPAGTFTALHLPGHVALHVQAPGYLAAEREEDLAGTPCAGRTEITLLRLGGRIAGRVMDARRFPIAGARVRVEPAGGAVRWATQGTVAGADGTFRVQAPATGTVRVVASHPSYVEAWVETEPGREVELLLARGVVVRGAVTDDIGQPLAATVTLSLDGREVRATASGAEGAFDLGRVGPGTYELRAAAAGYADADVTVGIDAPASDAEQGTRTVELSLRRGVTLEGRVVDRFGEPVEGALIEARLDGSRLAPQLSRSDADGRFAITGLAAGRWEIIAARDDLGTAFADATLDVGTRGRPVELAFRDAAVRTLPTGADAGTAAAAPSGKIAYSVAMDEVIVRTPAAVSAPGTDPLRAGDTIFQVERERIRDLETLQQIVARIHRPTLSVAVLRDGRRKFLTVDREALLADGW